MFKEIVVGVDGRQGGRDATALARRLLAPDGNLVLAHVEAGTSTEIGSEVRRVASSAPGRGLHELAEREAADLVVVGSCRRSLLGRVLMGDDTRAALNGAPCAVAVAPTGYAATEPAVFREVGVAYDGSPESTHALGTARELAAELGAVVSAFEVVSLPTDPYTGGVAAVDAEAIQRLVAEARERLAALGVEAHAGYGFPAEELGIYSGSVDLLVVGSRGYGPLGRLIHGSTSQHLARTARCPLLILPRSADKSERSEELRGAAAGVEVPEDEPARRQPRVGYVED